MTASAAVQAAPTAAVPLPDKVRKFRYPVQLIVSTVSDMATAVYALVAQLDRGPRGCFASVPYLSTELGVQRETVQRALAELGGWVRRDTDGALRRAPVTIHEKWATVPCDVVKTMSARAWRLYVWVTFCVAVGEPVSVPTIARDVLTRMDGRPVSVDTARRHLAALEVDGWVKVTSVPGKASSYEVFSRPRAVTERTRTPGNDITRPLATTSQTPGNDITPTPGNDITPTPGNDVTQSSSTAEHSTSEQGMLRVVRNGAVGEGDPAATNRSFRQGEERAAEPRAHRAPGAPARTPYQRPLVYEGYRAPDESAAAQYAQARERARPTLEQLRARLLLLSSGGEKEAPRV